jgi:hypothetical protein
MYISDKFYKTEGVRIIWDLESCKRAVFRCVFWYVIRVAELIFD